MDRQPNTARFLVQLFWKSDTTTIRVLIAVASIGFAVILWTHPDTFDRKGFAGMAWAFNQWGWGQFLGSANIWCVLFMLHGVGIFWRIWEYRTRGVRRPGWAFAINALGFFAWLVSTGLINQSVGELSPGTALEMTAVAAAFVTMVRTGLNDEPRPT